MPVVNLARIYEVAALSMKRIEGLPRSYDFLRQNADMPVLEFLAAEFLTFLRPIIEHGFRKEYHLRSFIGESPRGRIEVGRTFNELWAKGQLSKVISSSFHHQIDNHDNRVLKAAAELLLRQLLESGSSNLPLVRELAFLLKFLQNATRLERADWALLDRHFTAKHSNEDYGLALALSAGLLRESAVRIDQRGDQIDLSAVVVDFETLFENYLRNSLRHAVAQRALPLRIEDGNTTGKKPLFDNMPRPTAEPDIVVKNYSGHPTLIAEIKYKSFPNRDDVNQVITYAASYRLANVVLVHQADQAIHIGLHLHGQIGNVQVWRYGFPLSQECLEDEERKFAEAMVGLVSELDGAIQINPTPALA